ncbi:TetR/AcrR family transcriptional regulator [Microbacterium sp. ARD31]|jgi:AcrR family transcriptional regulator|uniref:TetR/AcrR family transcriptional regulator n=1 Tax=Microbacterium sp. ARD31 TaxID=2962576 RepID=UPI0028825D71|nr:TetR/AcrR family transcriptional regulator [Microbacterium sp. ARD31]MDT0187899.1 TetR/AcrR family transcriptional regulator [Microbacterium sp. ARD31]
MTSEATGTGQPSRTLALLWGEPAATGRRKGPARSVDVSQVVEAALLLADEQGLAAVTMRAVAERVGVSAMSVYTYVPGKPELLDLMVDATYHRMPRPTWGGRSWRDRLTLVAESNRELLTTHPWLTEVAALSRPPLGPGVMAKYEHELAAFDDTGLSDPDADAALTYLLGFVQTHCRSAHDAARITTDTAMSDAEWWAANQPLLARVLSPDAYPRALRIGAAAGEAGGSAWNADRAWRFGLARTLDGLAALIRDGG